MNWSDEDVRSAVDAMVKHDRSGEIECRLTAPMLRAVMDRAIELLAARGGTMTADAVRSDLDVMHSAASSTASCNAARARIEDHIAAQGVRIAALEGARPEPCCARDRDHDGNCDRHPIGTVARIEQHVSELERSLENARKERDAALWLAERRRQDRADALRVTTTDGLSASEWVARAGKAERERDEVRQMHAANVEAGARVSAAFDAAGVGGPRDGVLTRALALLKERDAALADNAALLERLKGLEATESLRKVGALP